MNNCAIIRKLVISTLVVTCLFTMVGALTVQAQSIEGTSGDWRLSSQHDADASGALEFVVRNVSGVFRITGGDTSRITVTEKRTLRTDSKSQALEQAKQHELRLERKGNAIHLVVDAGGKNGSSASYEIAIPSRMMVFLDIPSGNIDVLNVQQSLHIETGAGNVDVKKVAGVTSIRSGSGNISLQEILKEVTVNTGAGHVTASGLGSNLDVSTGGGNVITNGVSGNIKVVTAGGGLQISQIEGNATLFTSGGNIEARDVRGTIEASSSGGEIVVSRIGGRADISTNGGGIRASQMNGFVRAETMAGDVVIRDARAAFEVIAEVGNITVSVEDGSFLEHTDASIEGGYGNISLSLPKQLNGVVSAVVNENGSVQLTNPSSTVDVLRERPTSIGEQVRKGTYTFGKGGGRISISTRSGRITIADRKGP